jgi:flagellar hook assembly protein FlgD
MDYFKSIASSGIQEMKAPGFTVLQNVPNPVKDITTFVWELEDAAGVALHIYDLSGKMVFSQDFGQQTPGKHTFGFSTVSAGLPNGFYTFSFVVNNQQVSGKMIVNR